MEPSSSDGTTRPTYHRASKSLFTGLAVAVAAGLALIRLRPFTVEVHGPSMAPTLEPGDWAIATGGGRVRRGDVVVVEHPGQAGFEMVKRVRNIPGDLAPDGHVLGPGRYWVEGDQPEASTDSRQFGPVKHEHLIGVLRLVYWPAERRRVL